MRNPRPSRIRTTLAWFGALSLAAVGVAGYNGLFGDFRVGLPLPASAYAPARGPAREDPCLTVFVSPETMLCEGHRVPVYVVRQCPDGHVDELMRANTDLEGHCMEVLIHRPPGWHRSQGPKERI